MIIKATILVDDAPQLRKFISDHYKSDKWFDSITHSWGVGFKDDIVTIEICTINPYSSSALKGENPHG